MKRLLVFTSLVELILGVALLIVPSAVIKLLIGFDDSQAITVLGRFTGVVFFCFGFACFPLKQFTGDLSKTHAFRAMFTYNLLATIYLGYLKFGESLDGLLLLPAVVLHALITIYFVFIMMTKKENE